MIQWKRIEEAPDYWISNRGEIISKRIDGKELMLKLVNNQNTGYQQVTLVITPKGTNVKRKTFYPHQLVANAFVDNPNGYNRVNHKDLNKNNNHYWNLEWVSQEQNIHHYYNSNAKNKPRNMKPIEVWTITGDYIDTFPSINQAAKEMGYSPATVWRQVRGDIKNPERLVFKYKED